MNQYIQELAKRQITNKVIAKARVNSWVEANKSATVDCKLSYWDAQWGFVKYSQNMLVIVPKYNQIYNVGVGTDSTHAQGTKVERFCKYKNFFFIPTRQIVSPLKHPKYVMCDTKYDDLVYKISAGKPVRRIVSKTLKKLFNKWR